MTAGPGTECLRRATPYRARDRRRRPRRYAARFTRARSAASGCVTSYVRMQLKFFSTNDLPCNRTAGLDLITSVKITKRTKKNARKGTAPAGETRGETRARCKGKRRASPRQSHQNARPDGFDEATIELMKAALRKHRHLSPTNVLHCAVWRLLHETRAIEEGSLSRKGRAP
jgi:hypothetical protein